MKVGIVGNIPEAGLESIRAKGVNLVLQMSDWQGFYEGMISGNIDKIVVMIPSIAFYKEDGKDVIEFLESRYPRTKVVFVLAQGAPESLVEYASTKFGWVEIINPESKFTIVDLVNVCLEPNPRNLLMEVEEHDLLDMTPRQEAPKLQSLDRDQVKVIGFVSAREESGTSFLVNNLGYSIGKLGIKCQVLSTDLELVDILEGDNFNKHTRSENSVVRDNVTWSHSWDFDKYDLSEHLFAEYVLIDMGSDIRALSRNSDKLDSIILVTSGSKKYHFSDRDLLLKSIDGKNSNLIDLRNKIDMYTYTRMEDRIGETDIIVETFNSTLCSKSSWENTLLLDLPEIQESVREVFFNLAERLVD